jgi:hypothetical protein
VRSKSVRVPSGVRLRPCVLEYLWTQTGEGLETPVDRNNRQDATDSYRCTSLGLIRASKPVIGCLRAATVQFRCRWGYVPCVGFAPSYAGDLGNTIAFHHSWLGGSAIVDAGAQPIQDGWHVRSVPYQILPWCVGGWRLTLVCPLVRITELAGSIAVGREHLSLRFG